MLIGGAKQEFGRPDDRQSAPETIQRHGPAEGAGTARRVGVTVQTAANIIREPEKPGLDSGERTTGKSRGSPTVSLTLNPRHASARPMPRQTPPSSQ